MELQKGSKPLHDVIIVQEEARTNQGFLLSSQNSYGEMIFVIAVEKCQLMRTSLSKSQKGLDQAVSVRPGSAMVLCKDLYLFISIDNHSIFKRSMKTYITNY